MTFSDKQQLDFLICCLRHIKNNAKPDFEKVAEEVDARSTAAVYKRFERLMNAGKPASPSNMGLSTLRDVSSAAAKTSTTAIQSTPGAPSGTKRKRGGLKKSNMDDEDEDGLALVKEEDVKRSKMEPTK